MLGTELGFRLLSCLPQFTASTSVFQPGRNFVQVEQGWKKMVVGALVFDVCRVSPMPGSL